MDLMNQKQKERDTQREQCNREELVECMARDIPEDGKIEPLKGLYFSRSSITTETVYGAAEPSLCVIAQGSKEGYWI
jgi:hypothetical protein